MSGLINRAADMLRRNLMASAIGAVLVAFVQPYAGAVATNMMEKGRQSINLFDFLTAAEIANAKAGVKADLTAKIQSALNAGVGKRLVINAGKFGLSYVGWGTNGMALDVPSNIVIEFEPGAWFESMAHNATIYQMLRVWDRSNVTIIRPNMDGRKDLNAAVAGEFGMAIDIRGGNNVHVVKPVTRNCWGDGVYIGLSAFTGSPENITIDHHFADGCRRQGMSITAGVNVHVRNPVWQNIAGTAPAAGLDIEPDDNSAELRGIRIYNPKTKNCTTGIQIQLNRMTGATPKEVDIKITGHLDEGSVVGYAVNGADTSLGVNKLSGKIVSNEPVYIRNGASAFLSSEYDALGPRIVVERPTVIDCNRNALASPKYAAPFTVLRDTGSLKTYAIGGVEIIEPTVIMRTGSVPRLFSFQDVVNGAAAVRDCHFIDPVKLEGLTDVRGNFQGSGSTSDRYRVWAYAIAGSGTLDFNFSGPVSAPNTAIVLTLDTATYIAGAPDVIIRVPFGASCQVATQAGGNFVGQVAGKKYQALNAAGSYLRLRPLGAGVFLVIEMVGQWTVV
jgi:hypothetical protein